MTITQLYFTVHERARSWNPFLTSSLCHVQANKSFVHVIIDLNILQPAALGRLRKRDLTWQIQLILKSTYCQVTSDLEGRLSWDPEMVLNGSSRRLSGLSVEMEITLNYCTVDTCGSSNRFCAEWCNAASKPQGPSVSQRREKTRGGKWQGWGGGNCTCPGSEYGSEDKVKRLFGAETMKGRDEDKRASWTKL